MTSDRVILIMLLILVFGELCGLVEIAMNKRHSKERED